MIKAVLAVELLPMTMETEQQQQQQCVRLKNDETATIITTTGIGVLTNNNSDKKSRTNAVCAIVSAPVSDEEDDEDDEDEDDDDVDDEEEDVLISSEEEAELEAQRISLHELIGKTLLQKLSSDRPTSVSSSGSTSATMAVTETITIRLAENQLASNVKEIIREDVTKPTNVGVAAAAISTKLKTKATPSPVYRTISSIAKRRRCQQRINSNGSIGGVDSTSVASRSNNYGKIFIHDYMAFFNCNFCCGRYKDLKSFSHHLQNEHKQIRIGMERNFIEQQHAEVLTIKREQSADIEKTIANRFPSIGTQGICYGTVGVLLDQLILNCGRCDSRHATLELFGKHLRMQHGIIVGQQISPASDSSVMACIYSPSKVLSKAEVKIEFNIAASSTSMVGSDTSEGRNTPAITTARNGNGDLLNLGQSTTAAIPEGLQSQMNESATVSVAVAKDHESVDLTLDDMPPDQTTLSGGKEDDKENSMKKIVTNETGQALINDTFGADEVVAVVINKEGAADAVKRKGRGRPPGSKSGMKSTAHLVSSVSSDKLEKDQMQPTAKEGVLESPSLLIVPVVRKRKRKLLSKEPTHELAKKRKRLSTMQHGATSEKNKEPVRRKRSASVKSISKVISNQSPSLSTEPQTPIVTPKPSEAETRKMKNSALSTTIKANSKKKVSNNDDCTQQGNSKTNFAAQLKLPISTSISSTTINESVKPTNRPHRFACSYCNKSFHKQSRLLEHKRIHTGEKPFHCDECGKEFRIKIRLSEHLMRHRKEKAYRCEQCGLAISTKQDLALHKRHHTGDRRYQCPTCPKAFVRSSDLKIHVRVHTGEKPYSCDVCQKSFRANQNLIVHRRSHDGVKKYKCDQCDKAFMRKIDRKAHLRSHTGEKPFKCEICDRAYSSRVHVRTHLERDHGAEPTPRVRKKVGPKPKKLLQKQIVKQNQLIEELQKQLHDQIKGDNTFASPQEDIQMTADEAAARSMIELLKDEDNDCEETEVKQSNADNKTDVVIVVEQEMIVDDGRKKTASLQPLAIVNNAKKLIDIRLASDIEHMDKFSAEPKAIAKKQNLKKQNAKLSSEISSPAVANTTLISDTIKNINGTPLHKTRIISNMQEVSVTVSMQVGEVSEPLPSIINAGGKENVNEMVVDGINAAAVDAVLVNGTVIARDATANPVATIAPEGKITSYFNVVEQQAEA